MAASAPGDSGDANVKKLQLCAFYTRCLGDALRFMHDKHQTVHRGAQARHGWPGLTWQTSRRARGFETSSLTSRQPENTLLTADGRIVLTDFGCATRIDKITPQCARARSVLVDYGSMWGRSPAGERFGSPRYLPPKVFTLEPIGAEGDVHALIIFFVRAMTGQVWG